MIKIGILDKKVSAKPLIKILNQIADESKQTLSIQVYQEGKSLLDTIASDSSHFDIIFMDTKIDEQDGIEIGIKIRQQDDDVHIVYITKYKKYSFAAYKVHPYEYLLKPLSKQKAETTIRELFKKVNARKVYFDFSFNRCYYRLQLDDILYFESNKRQVVIHMVDGTRYKYYDTLNKIQERYKNTPADFIRIHQSTLVNAHHVELKTQNYVILSNGEKFVISKERRKVYNIKTSFC